MNLSKKEKTTLLKVYETWWNSYLNGDLETYEFYLDEDFRFVGSTDGEEFLDRKATTSFLAATADQLAGKAKLENIERTIETHEGTVIITDLANAFILNDSEWVYYARFRFSSMMKHTEEGWRFFYQHFSTPDLMANEGETLGIDKVTAENIELKNAIKRRTAELELKNRELEIESALERIRSKATAMKQSSDLLDIVVTMRHEFTKLGHRADYFWHMMWLPDKYEKAMTSGDGTRIGNIMELPRDFHHRYDGVSEWESGEEPFMILAMETEEAVDYIDKMITLGKFHQVDPNAPTLDDIRHIQGITFVMARTSHGEIGYSLPGVVKNPPKEDLDILVRFAGSFDLAHRRFLDLQQSEKQAREVQIELGLEKVRSRAMAMQNSDELSDLVDTVFTELAKLDFALQACIINLIDVDNLCNTVWMKSPEVGNVPDSYLLKFEDYPFHDAMMKGFVNRDTKFIYVIEGAEKTAYDAYLFSNTEFKKVSKEAQDSFTSMEKYVCSFTFSNFGGLQTIGEVPLSIENLNILERFGKVFDLTYTRFNDLQKAEAQAREAKIETALEKVRSRTMAMQHSDELLEVASVMFQQVNSLGVSQWNCGFNIWEKGDQEFTYYPGSPDGKIIPFSCKIPLNEHPVFKRFDESRNRGEELLVYEKIGEEQKDHYEYMLSLPGVGDFLRDMMDADFELPEYQVDHLINFAYGNLLFITYEQVPQMHDVFVRFAKVFEQVYTRFLDLKKAEEQAREAKIEAALERIRAASLAMHKSSELLDVIKVISHQLENLEVRFNHASFGRNNELEDYKFWTSVRGMDDPVMVNVPKVKHPMTERLKRVRKEKLSFYADTLTPKQHNSWNEHMFKHDGLPWMGKRQKNLIMDRPFARSLVLMPNIFLVVSNSKGLPFSDRENQIIKRVASVFEQTYTRFLDLKKAEAQARESQIEAALERVRSKTMAMHNSKDMEDIVITLFEEVLELGLDSSLRCGLGILEGHEGMETRSVNADSEGKVELRVGMLNMKIHPMLVGLKKAWKKGEKGYSYYYSKEDVRIYYKALNDEPEYPFNANLEELPQQEYHRSYFFSSGILFAFSEEPISEESSGILARFASVFGQTYRRYLDLQKAEAQAKEAQIEAALEKVRSRTMAMQSSHELQEAANLLFLEVQDLGINAWSAGYNILSEDKKSSICWMSSEGELQDPFPLYYTEEASFKEMGKFLKGKKKFFVQELKGKALVDHYDYMKSLPELTETFKQLDEAGLSLPTYQVNHLCKFSQGYLLFITYEKVPDAHDVFQRFTKVFEQTYTRFLDLQKAENQSREAQVELALERVRASTMAMHKSEQLAETAEVLFEQFDILGKIPDRFSIAILNKEKRQFEFWVTDQEGTLVDHRHDFSIDEPTCMAKIYKSLENGNETHIVDLQGKELEDWIRYVAEEAKMEIDASNFEGRRVQNAAFFSQGYLMLSSHLPISDEMMQLLVRFAKVFEQSYRRFLDLQNAEKQAREAIKRTSVDRVRAEIASMRTSKDLNRITPLVWTELTTLNVPFIRCGVFIMDEEKEEVQTHLSTPDGKALASFQLPFEDTKPLDKLLPFWQKKEMYTDYWDRKAFIESTRILMEKGAIYSKETYITKNQPSNLYLHFLPFLQGMLYVGSEVPLNEDELSLVQNLADAFSSAYARYEDFNKLELANKKIEKTLVDLRQAQSQLVQSEKMASLGELTAGIAHEIQNPLNFVNNFAEVSSELVDEMNEEIDGGDMEEVKYISKDLKLNLEKINHHGKRAGAIVKGMLQHSRTSSGTRELTDINVLADEYLRLAFHGLRAKDKSFNADFKLEIDESLPKVDIVPQDFGRVLLNLINNAFYAVDEKKKQCDNDFEPVVILSTKTIKGGLQIKVSDNGNGIPKKVLEKIFQPFFTTKPTGKGTGLGLSLSYDIVKAHGGELKVTTKEGEGTTFSINLFF